MVQPQTKRSTLGKIFSWGLGWDGMEGDCDVKFKPHKNKEKEKKKQKESVTVLFLILMNESSTCTSSHPTHDPRASHMTVHDTTQSNNYSSNGTSRATVSLSL